MVFNGNLAESKIQGACPQLSAMYPNINDLPIVLNITLNVCFYLPPPAAPGRLQPSTHIAYTGNFTSRSVNHPTAYAVPNPNCCKNGNVFSAARCPSAMASSAR